LKKNGEIKRRKWEYLFKYVINKFKEKKYIIFAKKKKA